MEPNEFKKNTKVVVTNDAPFHKGRSGVVAFYGRGPSDGTLVLRDANASGKHVDVLFAVSRDHVQEAT